jgi:hypothetical protein
MDDANGTAARRGGWRAALRGPLAAIGWVGAGAAVTGVTGLIIMVLTAAILPPAANARFMVYWSALYWVYGALTGVQQETVRTVRAARLEGVTDGAGATGSRVRVIPWGLATGAVLAACLLATYPLWSPRLAGDDSPASALLIAAGCLLFSGLAANVGAFTGLGVWPLVGGLNAADGVARATFIALALTVVGGAARLQAAEAAAITGAGVWLVFWLFSRRVRSVWHLRGDATPREYPRLMAQTVLANAASFSLVVGYPTVLALMLTPAQIDAAAGLLFAISMTRAPLMMPINAFQGMVVAKFVGGGTGRVKLLALLAGAVGAGGVALAALVAWIGPWLLGYLRPEYHLSAGVLAGLTLAAAMLGLVFLTGSVVLAMKRHGPYLLGWALAIGVSVAVLATGLSLETRVIVSLMSGPALGAAVHAAAILADSRRPRP